MTAAAPPVRPRATLASRRRVMVAVTLLVVVVGALLYQGLSNAATYFYTADQAVAHRADQGSRTFRIEGVVVPGTLHTQGSALAFQIENNGVNVDVLHTGGQPELFKANVPVVLQGHWEATTFASDQIMIRHTATYRQQNPGRVQDYQQ